MSSTRPSRHEVRRVPGGIVDQQGGGAYRLGLCKYASRHLWGDQSFVQPRMSYEWGGIVRVWTWSGVIQWRKIFQGVFVVLGDWYMDKD